MFWIGLVVFGVLGLAYGGGCRIRTSGATDSPPPVPPCTVVLPSEPRAIVELFPSSTPVNGSFNVQSDGRSAIAVKGTGFTQRDKIYWDGTRLVTTYGDSTLLTALVPKEMFTRAGAVTVSVKDPVFLTDAEVRAPFRVVAAP